MKTLREILTEAQQLEAQRQRALALSVPGAPSADAEAVRLLTLPDSPVTPANLDADSAPTPVRTRWIELAPDASEFVLMQGERQIDASGGVVREIAPFIAVRSESAYEVLSDGYEAIEEERLARVLQPYIEGIEEDDYIDLIDASQMREIESLVGAGEMAPAALMRTRVDIAAFLEGRLEPGNFISAVIRRHCYREGETQTVRESHGERMTIE